MPVACTLGSRRKFSSSPAPSEFVGGGYCGGLSVLGDMVWPMLRVPAEPFVV